MADFDIAVIGAGCTGSAIAWQLAKYSLNIAVIEKSSDVSMGATKANSGIIHSGYFIKEGSLKEKTNLRANPMFDQVCPALGIEFKRIGAMFCALDAGQATVLQGEYIRARRRGLDCELINAPQSIRNLEPLLKEEVMSALHFRNAGIIMPFEFTAALAEHAVLNGACFYLNTRITQIVKNHDEFILDAGAGKTIRAKVVINAAGAFAGKLAEQAGIKGIKIIPRRGEYILFDRGAMDLKKIIFPTPTPGSKGIVIAPTLHGNSFIGPNAQEAEDEESSQTTRNGLNEIMTGAARLINNIPMRQAITNFAGVRATPEGRDFIIGPSAVPGFFNAAGIESPGLSASLGIAALMEELLKEHSGLSFVLKDEYFPALPAKPKLSQFTEEELERMISENPQWANVVCRCETVTEAQIVQACRGLIPSDNTDMIKRRLRPGMGRCQGGFCLTKVMKILSRERNIPLGEITKSGEGSKIVVGRLKNLQDQVFHGSAL